jgi:hypothetical protein
VLLFKLELFFELEQLFEQAVVVQLFKLEVERILELMAERTEVQLRQVLQLLLVAMEQLFEELVFVELLMAKH